MKVMIACDSFKESLDAEDVVRVIAEAFEDVFPNISCVRCPMADGGEGTVAAFVTATGAQRIEATVTGPLGAPVKAGFGLSADGELAVIELAEAAGLMLVPPAERDPCRATTRGVGELVKLALDRNCRRVVLAVGGSATNDGGAGLAQALGARLLDAGGREIGAGGLALRDLARIDISALDPHLKDVTVDLACDVDNPLLGPDGASAMFGPQKGASPAMVTALDEALGRYAQRLRDDVGRDVAHVSGAGAAGGTAAGAMAFLDARMRSGFELMAGLLGLEEKIREVDLVITGEGRLDEQTARGKVPAGVASMARRQGKPVIALGGSLGKGVDSLGEVGIDAVFGSVPAPASLEEVLKHARENLRRAARNVALALQIGQRLPR
ncbi:glycerate kinase [Acetobacter estunensis NRIC 0472]|uniref:Glycerate kinase n=1 Tax=Acetobacter estunensis TaxID=104097 RepID=A0A967B653_9PROT|nr:glycerate kinase [Acetobacter estunensis]NHO53119.1 glycerate kinase [Acetobacter estunensis]GBQ24758.1 glycerate kinase [Acetobacter estunensis NRIC 0472]